MINIQLAPPGYAKRLEIIHAIDAPSTELSVRQICDRAGISRQTFYRYFDSKDDMLNYLGRYFRAITIDQVGIRWSWLEAYEQYYTLILGERDFFLNLAAAGYLQDGSLLQYRQHFTAMLGERGIAMTPQLTYAVWGWSMMDLKFSTGWVKDGMPTPPHELARLVVGCLPAPLAEAFA